MSQECTLLHPSLPVGATRFGLLRRFDGMPTEALTVSFWAKNPNGTLLSVSTDVAGSNTIQLSVRRDPESIVLWLNEDGDDVLAKGVSLLPRTDVSVLDGRWHYVVVTWLAKSGLAQLYVDGSLQAQDEYKGGEAIAYGKTSDAVCVVVGENMRKSCSPDSFGEDPFTGSVAHLGVWSTTFTDNNVIAEAINPLAHSQPKSDLFQFLRMHLADFDPEVGALERWQDLSKYGHHVSFTNGKVAPLIACPSVPPKFTPVCTLEFPTRVVPSDTSFARVPVFKWSSTELTFSFWMKSTKSGPGTVVSYATEGNLNAFAVTVSRDLVRVQVNDAEGTDLSARASLTDGYWHHVSIVWSNLVGLALFVNSTSTDDVPGYQKGVSLPTEGCLVLAEMQASFCDATEPSVGFEGQLGYVTAWRHALTAEKAEFFMNEPSSIFDSSRSSSDLAGAWQPVLPDPVLEPESTPTTWYSHPTSAASASLSGGTLRPLWRCPPAPAPVCNTTEWFDGGECQACSTCTATQTVLHPCTESSDTECTPIGRGLGDLLSTMSSHLTFAGYKAARDTLDAAAARLETGPLREVEFSATELDSLQSNITVSLSSVGSLVDQTKVRAGLVEDVAALVLGVPNNLAWVLAAHPELESVDWSDAATQVQDTLASRDTDFYLDSDANLIGTVSRIVTSSSGSEPGGRLVGTALLPAIHRVRVRAIHDVRIIAYHHDLARLTSRSTSSLETSWYIEGYSWEVSSSDESDAVVETISPA